MRWSRRKSFGTVGGIACVAAVVWLVGHHGRAVRRFDPARARETMSSRIRRVQRLVASHAGSASRGSAAITSSGSAAGVQLPSMRKDFIEPECFIGTRALCDAMTPLVDSCDAGSAADCAAIAQELTANPPRQLIAITFIYRACKLGDQASCDRVAEIKKPSNEPCEKDPFACEWRAYRADRGSNAPSELTEQACSLGAAESCMFLATKTTDKAAAQAYIETSCQLGNPIACMVLAKALEPGCVPAQRQQWCFPPDEAEQREAQAMACDAGWLTGADCPQ